MTTILIRLPSTKHKFQLKCFPLIETRQYLTAIGLLQSTERAWRALESEERIVVKVKRYIGSHLTTLNETIASSDREYLVYALSCFLEDYLSPEMLSLYVKRFLRYQVSTQNAKLAPEVPCYKGRQHLKPQNHMVVPFSLRTNVLFNPQALEKGYMTAPSQR